jgi:methylated-DNA-[protein]-cysteine S-methyltransferase
MILFTQIESPIDPLMLVSDGENLTGLYMNVHKWGPNSTEGWTQDDRLPLFTRAQSQLEAYFAGELREFDLPLRMAGTEFQRQVWNGLKQIPYGETLSYGAFAKRLGKPNGSRAVGLANGKNPISIVVPCHRVIGADGSLTGYGGGLPRKQTLLNLEAKVAGQGLLFA